MDKKQIETTIERINHILNKAQRNDKEIFLLFSEREALRTAIECMQSELEILENKPLSLEKMLKMKNQVVYLKSPHYCDYIAMVLIDVFENGGDGRITGVTINGQKKVWYSFYDFYKHKPKENDDE